MRLIHNSTECFKFVCRLTRKTPKERFNQHKTGYVNKKGHKLSAYIVQKYGSYLRPSLYDHINEKPMTRQEALTMKGKLALELRRQVVLFGLTESRSPADKDHMPGKK